MPPSSCTRRTSRAQLVLEGSPAECLPAAGPPWRPPESTGRRSGRPARPGSPRAAAAGAHAVAQVLRALVEQRVLDQPSSDWSCSLSRSSGGHLGAAEALLPRALLAQPRVARLLERDLAVVGLGGVVGAPDIEVHDAVGAPGGEHQRQSARAGGTGTTGIEGCAGCRRSAEACFRLVALWQKWRSGRDSNPRPPA